MADAESLAQSAVERLTEDEALRGDLTDAGFSPIIEWATNALLKAAQDAANQSDDTAQTQMDQAESNIKRLIGGVIEAAQQPGKDTVTMLMNDPTVASDSTTRQRLAANGWRLGADVDANAQRLTKALRGIFL